LPSSKPQVDREDFLAWKDSPMTQWVLQRLRAQAQETSQALQDHLWAQVAGDSLQWQQSQPSLAHQRGRVEGVIQVAEVTYEDVLTEDEEQWMTENAK
jgi:seryl-tRNA(Sec) selenium transferase